MEKLTEDFLSSIFSLWRNFGETMRRLIKYLTVNDPKTMEKLTEDVLINIFTRLPGKQVAQMRCVCKPWNAFLSESYLIKSHLNHSKTMEKLSEDVLINIFIRLPAKEVAQMRCVCKPWDAIFTESYYIKSRLNHNNEIVMAFNYELPDSEHALPCKVYDLSQSPIIELNDHVKLPHNFPQSALNKYGARVIGSVNGLICFSIGYDDRKNKGIYIWNPSVSVVTTLPPFDDQERLTDPSLHIGGYRYKFRFGFGFDPEMYDYKVVKLTEDIHADNDGWGEPVEVYSMNYDYWQFIDDSFISDVEFEGGFVDDHDGHLLCLCYYINNKKLGLKHTIVAFDLGAESSFRQISLPDSLAYRKNAVLGMLEGKICVMSYTQDDGKFEVWVMNEYGVADSWVKSHVLSKLKGYTGRPYGFTLNNKFLFCDDSKGLLGCYDQETDKVTHFGSRHSNTYCIVPYVESLVW